MGPTALKRRLFIELLTLAAIATTFLVLAPERPVYIEIALALLGLFLLGLNVNFTTHVVWEPFPPIGDQKARSQASYQTVMVVTLLLALMCLGAGIVFGYVLNGWVGAWHR
ncbi:MAG: hypothetical protein R3351_04135, partial [Nitrospirales bacterium]|nr:hypothetical protein [Nitrospirales bacterium]